MMIANDVLEQQLKSIPEVVHVAMTGDGYHYHVEIVSDVFVGKTKVARQQWVYQQLKEHITTGKLHALTMTTWTNAEWEKNHG